MTETDKGQNGCNGIFLDLPEFDGYDGRIDREEAGSQVGDLHEVTKSSGGECCCSHNHPYRIQLYHNCRLQS